MLKTVTPEHSTAWARPSVIRKSLMIAAVSVFLPAVAVAQAGTQPGTQPGAQPGTTGAAATSAHLSTQDKHFVHAAAQAGLSEVQEGQLAQSKGTGAVQKVGARMVTDHTKINHELTILAQTKGITVPSSATNAQAAQLARLKETSGASFDRLYLRDQKRAHEQAIRLFRTEAESGTDPDLKKFAATNLPTLQEHLQMIEAAQKQETTAS